MKVSNREYKPLVWSDNDLMFQEIQRFNEMLVVKLFCSNIKLEKDKSALFRLNIKY